jgi:hypothetical protein
MQVAVFVNKFHRTTLLCEHVKDAILSFPNEHDLEPDDTVLFSPVPGTHSQLLNAKDA